MYYFISTFIVNLFKINWIFYIVFSQKYVAKYLKTVSFYLPNKHADNYSIPKKRYGSEKI